MKITPSRQVCNLALDNNEAEGFNNKLKNHQKFKFNSTDGPGTVCEKLLVALYDINEQIHNDNLKIRSYNNHTFPGTSKRFELAVQKASSKLNGMSAKDIIDLRKTPITVTDSIFYCSGKYHNEVDLLEVGICHHVLAKLQVDGNFLPEWYLNRHRSIINLNRRFVPNHQENPTEKEAVTDEELPISNEGPQYFQDESITPTNGIEVAQIEFLTAENFSKENSPPPFEPTSVPASPAMIPPRHISLDIQLSTEIFLKLAWMN